MPESALIQSVRFQPWFFIYKKKITQSSHGSGEGARDEPGPDKVQRFRHPIEIVGRFLISSVTSHKRLAETFPPHSLIVDAFRACFLFGVFVFPSKELQDDSVVRNVPRCHLNQQNGHF